MVDKASKFLIAVLVQVLRINQNPLLAILKNSLRLLHGKSLAENIRRKNRLHC